MTRARGRPALPAPGEVARALRAAGVAGASALESGLARDGLGRFSFVVGRPAAVLEAASGEPLRVVAWPPGRPRPRLPRDPLAGAAAALRALAPARGRRAPPAPFPFAGGGVLTLAYDLGRRLERLPVRARADAPWPDLHLAVHETVLAFDHDRGVVRRLGRLGRGAGLTALEVARALLAAGSSAEPRAGAAPAGAGRARGRRAPAPTLDGPAYRRAVAAARTWIRRGDLFEVNLSRRWTLEGVDPDRLARAVAALAPAPYMADLDLGRGRRLVSASPERFLRLGPGGDVETWPIKGTRPRDADHAVDRRLARELLASEKEAAELAMIVDLARSDLGRVAVPGSVVVPAARRLQTWPAVHHTVGVVAASLAPGRGWDDLVRATFPPGSVTGAPKVRAQEVIEALEPVRRGPYCGAFGWVGWDGALDLAVAIRIAYATGEGGPVHVHAGGAVTLPSDPAAEERETRAKAAALLRAAGFPGGGASRGEARRRVSARPGRAQG